jgi:cell division protein ZapA
VSAPVSEKNSVSIRLRGQDFRLRTEDDEASLQRVASYVDETMSRIEQRTGTVDSLDVALLTALNLARELVQLRERGGSGDPARLRELIELAEATVSSEAH